MGASPNIARREASAQQLVGADTYMTILFDPDELFAKAVQVLGL
jgi:hypothetical protein